MLRKIVAGAALAVIAVVTVPVQSVAEGVDFSGQRITMIVPFQEGSGSTIHARLFATALEENLPGKPSIVVRNIDGGGSVRGINQFHADSRIDGSIFAAIASGTFFQYLAEDSTVAYPLPDFQAFLSSPFGLLVYARTDAVPSDDPVEMARHLAQNPPRYGATTPTSSDLPAMLSLDLLGIKANYVFGVSSSESLAGIERGEFTVNDDNMASWAQQIEPLVKEGVIHPLFTLGYEQNGEIVRDPVLPEVPTFLEVYEAMHGKPLSGVEYSVWRALFNVRVMASKMFVLPGGTPKEIVDAYSEAATKALAAPRLQGDQAQLILGPYPQNVGEAAKEVHQGALTLTDEERSWLHGWLERTHQVKR